MTDNLAKFAATFGRFQSASIELSDGRRAAYSIPQNVTMKPLGDTRKRPQHANVGEPTKALPPQTGYAKARHK